MVKELIAISVIALALTNCSTQASGATQASAVAVTQVKEPVSLVEKAAIVKSNLVKEARLLSNTKKVNTVISQLKGRVNKTWYVFSGATPQGWDCSGLVMWAYEQLGYNLEHRASKQQSAGAQVKSPKAGDIVVFTYNGSKSAYHTGIYVGPDKMIHAGGGKGESTSIVSISKFAGKHSTVVYRRVLETV